jgi:hypothetical protein
MAHWAEIDDTNKVIRVLVGDNNDPNGDEGYQWLIDNLGGTWIKTSFNTVGGVHLTGGVPFRKNYAAPDYSYDVERDAFIPPKPFLGWLLDEESCQWEPPVAYPDDGNFYDWDEDNLNWKLILN